jgi:hypothetical protein
MKHQPVVLFIDLTIVFVILEESAPADDEGSGRVGKKFCDHPRPEILRPDGC